MYFTFTGIVVLIVTIYLTLFTRTRTLFYFTFFMSAFTSTSIINFSRSRNSILCYYVVGSFFILKVLYEIIIRRYSFKKVKLSNGILYFLIYATISLVLPIVYSSNTLVFTPDSPYKYVSFSFQNITQYLYLLFSFIIYFCSYMVFVNEIKVNMKGIINITVITVVSLGFVQFFLSHEYFDLIFRTNYSHLVQYLETGLTRISSVTNEPSMLSLFLTPIFVYYLICVIKGFRVKRVFKFDICMLCLIFLTGILNRASSFYLALVVMFFIMIVDFWNDIFNYKNLEFLKKVLGKVLDFAKKNKIKSFIISIFLIGAFLIAFKIVGYRFLILFLKLLGLDDSGSTRMELFSHHMSVFLKNIFTGVGFGTLRSNDLLSMWSAQVGLFGMIPLMYYFISRFLYIFKNRRIGNNREILYLIVTSLIILITSVPEPYYIYTWIYMAMGESIYPNMKISNKAINKLAQREYDIEVGSIK